MNRIHQQRSGFFSLAASLLGSVLVLSGLMTLLRAAPHTGMTNVCFPVAVIIANDPELWALDCVGSCTAPSVCEAGTGTDPGYGEYNYCKTCGLSGGEDVCCHAIVTTSGESHKRGVCQTSSESCPKPPCQWLLSPDDNETYTRYYAKCTGGF